MPLPDSARRFDIPARESIMSAMRIGVPLFSILVAVCLAAQPDTLGPDSMGWVTGTVRDALSGEPLSGYGAGVYVENSDRGSGVDSAGRCVIPMSAGEYKLTAHVAWYLPGHASAKITAGDTAYVSFQLVSQRHVNDSVMATMAGIRFAQLHGDGGARRSKDIAYNNSVMAKAWRIYLKGKGRFGIRRTTREYIDIGKAEIVVRSHLIVDNGTCRVVQTRTPTRFDRLVRAAGQSYPRLALLQSRARDPNTDSYVTTPFNGVLPSDRELVFQFLDDSGRELGIF
jgi:hypothetical protein